MLALDQRKKSGVGATTTGSLAGSVSSFWLLEERLELDELLLARR